MKKEVLLAKLEMLRDMTDLESVKQLIDILTEIVTDTEIVRFGSSAIGFEMEPGIDDGIYEDKK